MSQASLMPRRLSHLTIFIVVLEHPTHGIYERLHIGRIVQQKASTPVIYQLRNRKTLGGNSRAPEISRFDDNQRSNIAPGWMYNSPDPPEDMSITCIFIWGLFSQE